MYSARVTRGENPYELLGVERTASQDEIKSAYRRLALRYHPDRNPGDETAEERFKAVSQAYATLRDPDSRARYDRLGDAGGRPEWNEVDWQSIFREAEVRIDWNARTGNPVFDMFFGAMTGMLRSSGLLPGQDLEVGLTLPITAARRGGKRTVRVPGPSVCPSCGGSGVASGVTCPGCSGRGFLRHGSTIEVMVPNGVKPGTRLRIKGLGGPGTPPGDVYVKLDVHLPDGVELRGRDLHGEIYLAPFEFSRGATGTVAGVRVTVPRGSRNGDQVRVPGGGLGGDLYVTVREDTWRGLRRLAGDAVRSLSRDSTPLLAKE